MDFNLMPLVVVLFQVYLFLTVFYLLLDNREPAETFAWIFIFILMPGVGVFFYFILGHNGRKRYRRDKKLPQLIAKNMVDLFTPLNRIQNQIIDAVKRPEKTYQDDLMMLLYKNSKALITTNNKAVFFHEGKSKFDALFADIEKAKRFIHLEYFMWYSGPDALGLKIKDLLIRKAKEGG